LQTSLRGCLRNPRSHQAATHYAQLFDGHSF
jgi:hypothetical protein